MNTCTNALLCPHSLLDTLCPQSPEHHGGAVEQVLRRLRNGDSVRWLLWILGLLPEAETNAVIRHYPDLGTVLTWK